MKYNLLANLSYNQNRVGIHGLWLFCCDNGSYVDNIYYDISLNVMTNYLTN